MAWVTLAVGLLAGFLAQRSRLCFVGGLRDFLLVRDTDLLRGAVAFFLAAWVTFPLLAWAGAPVWVPVVGAAVPAGRVVNVPAGGAAGGVGAADVPRPVPAGAPAGRPCGGLRLGPEALPALAAGAGFGLGLLATLSQGCPLRQHVLAAQGSGDAAWWVLGFAGGTPLYHQWILPVLAHCLG